MKRKNHANTEVIVLLNNFEIQGGGEKKNRNTSTAKQKPQLLLNRTGEAT